MHHKKTFFFLNKKIQFSFNIYNSPNLSLIKICTQINLLFISITTLHKHTSLSFKHDYTPQSKRNIIKILLLDLSHGLIIFNKKISYIIISLSIKWMTEIKFKNNSNNSEMSNTTCDAWSCKKLQKIVEKKNDHNLSKIKDFKSVHLIKHV